ncbi:MAG: putative lipid II flippase FtsW [Gorillibacterium sp.]|nr:putative lipid II flippase FtsW [Gorillibacterium sp.]
MNQSRKNSPDYLFLFLTMILTAFGLLMVYSASSMISAYENKGDSLRFVITQGIAVGLGLFMMLILMNVHYSLIRKLVFLLWFGNLFLLVLVLFIGNGDTAKSWIDLGPINLQPSEFAKLAVILYLAVVVTNKGEKIKKFKKGLFPCLMIIGMTGGLIMLQPDFGSTAILVLGAFAVLWVGGMRTKHLLTIGVFTGSLVFLKIFLPSFLNPKEPNYQLERFLTMLDPWRDPTDSGYQMINSLYAFGHGGLTGAGMGNSIQKLHFLTQSYSDFIFSIIGEELGFLMTVVFLIIYSLFVWRGIIVSLRCPNKFASLAGVGIMSTIGIQALINLLGVTNTIPMTGVTLPLISYGGSSILATLISIGIVLGISREQIERKKKH